MSKFDAYPMPQVDELLDWLGTARFFSTLDLTKGYWQIRFSPESKEKSAFSTPYRLYQFNTLPLLWLFGAPATFQHLMDRVLPPYAEYAAAYLDDVIIHSDTWHHHIQWVVAVLESLRRAGPHGQPKEVCNWTEGGMVFGVLSGIVSILTIGGSSPPSLN